MKKLSISLLVMLLIASLFTSCSMGSDDASDVRVKVRLTPSGGGRSLNTDFETINLDDDNITWHYSAAKVSETQFNYGATSDSLLPKDGIVTLSQGEWKIKLWAYKDSKKVYDSDESNVTIKWNFYEPNVTVTVLVKQNTGDNGYIVLTDVKIPVNEELKTPNYASIDTTIITNLNGANMRIECAQGSHTITFAYKDGNDVKASMSLVVTVISGRETKISGDITKEELSTGSSAPTLEVQAIEVKKDSKVEVITSIAPAQPSSSTEPQNKTTVTFPAGSFNADSANAVLNLSVKSAGEITVTSTEVPAVAGIDISLLVNNQPVTEFNGKEVVIETYIAKDLTNVSVKYNGAGDQPIATDDDTAADKTVAAVLTSSSPATDLGYNPSTGLLRFKTNHFSEYYVLADVEALNVSTGILYKELTTAIKEAKDGDTFILLDNIVTSSPVVSMNSSEALNVTFDLNGKTIESSANKVFAVEKANNGLVLKNGTIKHTGTGSALYIKGEGITLTVDNVVITSNDLSLLSEGTKSHITINKSKITSNYFGMTQNGLYGGNTIEIRDSEITDNSDQSVGIYISGNKDLALQNLIVENSIITGETAIEVKHTNVTITGSTLNATKQNVSYSEDGSGSTTVGYCLALTGNLTADTTRGTVKLSGNTYNSANPGCEVFNSSAINGVNNGATIEGYDITHVLSPDRLMPVCRIQGTDTVYYSAYDLRNPSAADLKNKTVILQSDELLKNEIYLSGKSFTLDLNGHSLSLEYGEGITPNNGSVIYVGGKNSKLTINDSSEEKTGSVYGSEKSYANKVTSAVRVGNYGKLVINGGKYYGRSDGTSCIFVHTNMASSTKATVTINGGYFETVSPSDGIYYVLNHQDSATRDCKIIVNGGVFKNYKPGVTSVDPVNADTGKIVLGTGCSTSSETVGSDTFYTVSK